MSWRELSKNSARLLQASGAVLILGLSSVGIGGCGFHPLYGPTASGANLDQVMKTIQIATIPSRTGQRLRNELIFGTGGGAGEAVNPVYRLDVALRESVRNGFITSQGIATGQVVQLDAEYRLVRIRDNETVFKGYSTSEAAYDRVGSTGVAGSTYGDVRAAIDAENRAARTLADTMKTRVAAYLSSAA
jgi:LPS-assembly lipoprotein